MHSVFAAAWLFLAASLLSPVSCNWDAWWTYDGISGPSYWGVINPAWTMCSKGRHQSPINLNPRRLVHDSTLTAVRVDKQPVSGVLYNTGQSLVFRAGQDRLSSLPVNITGGPFSYRYQFEQLYFHWGPSDSPTGSEHALDKAFFPGELQILGFNADLFRNLSEAEQHPHGAAAIAVMIREADRERSTNKAVKAITEHLQKVIYRGQNFPISRLNLADLLPSTDGYMTYEGSTTYPGCWESVTWVVMNKPIYVTRQELGQLRLLMQGDKISPKAPLARNVRPMQEMHGRSIRTNVAFQSRKKAGKECPDVAKDTVYKANSVWTVTSKEVESAQEGGY